MRPPSDFHDPSGYARPQQAWQCGLGDEGPPCAWGPDPRGGCPALAACRPTRDGDRWICNRAELRGGPCTPGPGPDGACPVVSRCTPVRALRTRRGRWAGACLAAAVGAACLALSGPWRNELIVPGPLSAHHAHLVVGDAAGARCARCHAAVGETIGAWLGWRTSAESRPSQASLCMQCRESSFSPEWAETAHNWPPRAAASLGADDLVANASESRRRDPHASIACAACHREHQGRDHQLAAVGDAECQACHRQRFASFAGDHPELRDWPYARQPNLAFDHALHEPRRDPENHTFACVDCHEPDSAGHRQRTLPYEQACATCHDQALQTSLAQGLPLVALPSVDVAALASSAPALGPWPQAADGDFDGVLPAAATLLVLHDPATAAAVRTLRTPV
ncbi:MAG TPA: hypothetical protein PKC18_19135, partial [Lacipirellulaceae bacterium]|nr:hypothetical protein [Lacipirellulaceae bacterium]